MPSILNHRWGVSRAADRVWAEVGGFGPSKAGGRLLMTLQAVIDDSYDPDGVYVLAGYIASAEAWAAFSREWEELLPLAPINKAGIPRFKMAQMAARGRMDDVAAFYRVIERYVLASISAKIAISDLRRVQARILVPGHDIDWAMYADPYYVSFLCLMNKFHMERSRRPDLFPEDQKIDFYFDDQSNKKAIAAMWDDYMAKMPADIKKFYGVAPIYRDDEDFLPLQAADFWAWWVHKWYREGSPEKVLAWGFDEFAPAHERKYTRIEIVYDQNALASTMTNLLRKQIGPGKPIIDLRGLDSFAPGSE